MVVRLFSPWIGGTERQAQKLARQLLDDGTYVQLATGRWFRGTPRQELVDGIPVFRNHTLWECFGVKGLRKFGGYLYIVTLMWHLWRRRHTYDVIHVHGLNYHAFSAVVMGRWLRRPTIVKLSNSGPASDIRRMREGWQLALSGLLLPMTLRADRFVALNRAVVDELREAGVHPARIIAIPNGVSVAREASRGYALHAPPRLVYVGRLHEQKGLDVLLRALTRLRSTPQPAVNLVGTGPFEDKLRALAQRLGVAGAVEFTGTTESVMSVLREADLFVLPSRAEGLSNALLEAMAAGLPVVASAIPGNRDVIDPGTNGLLFDSEDPEALADALQRLLADGGLRRRLGREARKTVEERFALETVAARYRELYAELRANREAIRT